MTGSAQALLASLIDYAGMFPPAELGLAEAMKAYGQNRAGTRSWMLGRFVLASDAIDEFETLAPAVLGAGEGRPWRLSVVGPRDAMPDAERVARFNEMWTARAIISSIEFGPMAPGEIREVARSLPPGVEPFFEISPPHDVDACLAHIANCGARAKIRTGGMTPNAVPDIPTLVSFFLACRKARVAFKATAGLHHAVRGDYRLTYTSNSPNATMHGFLNVVLAAALVHAGGDRSTSEDILRESSAAAFAFSNAGVRWRDETLTTEQLAECRWNFFTSFGSCAFGEPVDELMQLGIVSPGERSARSQAGSQR